MARAKHAQRGRDPGQFLALPHVIVETRMGMRPNRAAAWLNYSEAAMRSADRQFPAYGRELLAAQRAGRNVPWLLIALGWDIGRALPRIVVARDIDLAKLDLCMVSGLECLVAHDAETERALDVAIIALRAGARACSIKDRQLGITTHWTSDIRAAMAAEALPE